jgi:hypothetical protein
MQKHIKALLCAASVLVIAGCTSGTMTEFYSEAGAEIDEGGFGNPTMNNMMAHMASTCAGRPKGYIVPEGIVVRDPANAGPAPVYRHAQIQCSGRLDGKYASVIYRGYVASASEVSQSAEASAGATQ